jgi:hypothetical protein
MISHENQKVPLTKMGWLIMNVVAHVFTQNQHLKYEKQADSFEP